MRTGRRQVWQTSYRVDSWVKVQVCAQVPGDRYSGGQHRAKMPLKPYCPLPLACARRAQWQSARALWQIGHVGTGAVGVRGRPRASLLVPAYCTSSSLPWSGQRACSVWASGGLGGGCTVVMSSADAGAAEACGRSSSCLLPQAGVASAVVSTGSGWWVNSLRAAGGAQRMCVSFMHRRSSGVSPPVCTGEARESCASAH